jgi:hypothetical protein
MLPARTPASETGLSDATAATGKVRSRRDGTRRRQAGWTGRLAVLDGLPDRPLPEHAEVYQSLHADLQAALAEIDGA